MSDKAALERALAGAADPTSAARALFKELFGGHRGAPLAAPLWEMLSATAERATAVQMTTPPIASGLSQAEALGDDGARVLAAGSFPRLRSIDVSRCWLTDQGIAALSRTFAAVHSDDQQDDDGDPGERYIAGRE